MGLDFPKRSDRKILERIIPPLSDGRDKFHYVRFQRVSQKKASRNKEDLNSLAEKSIPSQSIKKDPSGL
jgi:hypothetical protein